MPIQEANIVFVESQVMDDVPEGGGAATGNVIVDGQMNNVFEDISDLDRAYGRFNLRKVFLAVRALNTDLYGGAKSLITQLPEDPDISYTLFSNSDPFDIRSESADRVESYLFKGPMWHGYLNSNHISGMMAINVIQRVGTVLPPIGKTLCLVQNEGLSNEMEQYVRVTDVDAVETVFEDSQGQFTRWVVTLEISDALRHNFTGFDVSRLDSTLNYTGKVRLRDTTVADAARYYSSQPAIEAANIGDLTIKAASMFQQLVPSARTETPLVAQHMNPELVQTLSAGARTVEVPNQAHTKALQVTAENRRLNWIETLSPRPAAGLLAIAYMSQGNWYVLTDDGAGVISGSDPGFGAGTVNYTTGDTIITLGALPDAGSQIMYAWASPVHYAVRVGHPDIDTTVEITHSVEEPIKPGTLALTWLQSAVTKTATANAQGIISGDATGYVSHGTGQMWIRFTTPPDFNSQLGIDYERQAQQHQTFTGVGQTGGLATVSVGEAIEPGSVVVEWATDSVASKTATIIKKIWGVLSGSTLGWRTEAVEARNDSRTTRHLYNAGDDDGDIVDETGSVNYATGQIVIPVLPLVTENTWSHAGTWSSSSGTDKHVFATGIIDVWYAQSGASATVVSTTIDIPPVQFRIVPRLFDEVVIPNSVRFTWNGQTYNDYNGVLYRNNDTVIAGTIDYLSGIVTLDDYVSGSGSVSVTSLLTRYGQWTAIDANFRTALAPLVPEALQIVAVLEDGTQITGNADENGDITGTYMRGEVNYNFGTAWVEFGQLNGEVWEPSVVIPESITYNAVAYKYLPLDAEILGIDAVRLPPDGRVPIYRPGNILFIMHADETAPATVVNEDTINCGRTRIAWVRVIDNDGVSHAEGFDLDRATGVVTFTDVSAMAMPVKVRHVVGDLRMCTDAQINGQLALSRPLTHNFPADETIVASCLIHGDRRARVSHVWDQASWNGTWVDYLVGNEATATLDVIAYPITVTNEGAETERWVLRWTSTTNVELIGQRRGLVYSGAFSSDIAPINPRTRVYDEGTGQWIGGVPYLTIPVAANGGGWSTGNVVRINTVGAIADIWMARSIQQSDEPFDEGRDCVEIYALGNIDRP